MAPPHIVRDDAASDATVAKRDATSRLPFKSVAFVCALHAVPLLGAALVLPWRQASWFTLSAGGLACLHVAVVVTALSRRERAFEIAWQVLAVCSLIFLASISTLVLSSALYLIELYRGIGRAISLGLAGVWALFVLFTVPVSAWGISATAWPRWFSKRRAAGSSSSVALLVVLAPFPLARAARAQPVPHAAMPEIQAVARAASSGGTEPAASLFQTAPAACAEAVDAGRNTLLVTTLDRSGAAFGACLQAADGKGLARALERLLAERAQPGAPVKLDLVRAVHALARSHPLIDALKVRPALDGVCGAGKCLAPWQLVALDSFTRYRPLDDVKDASFGCSFDDLASSLGSKTPAREVLLRIETESVLARGGTITPLVRLRPLARAATPETLESAARLAEKHILSAQEESGAFRYLIDPFSGRTDEASLNLPRQAGTVLVLCELGRERKARAAIRRVLEELARHERQSADRSALVVSGKNAQLGHTALPLIAFASCRERAGAGHDVLIGRLARLLLDMQREDGSFYPEFDLRSGVPRGAHTPLYAGGQAVFALVLVEQLANAVPGGPFPGKDLLARGVERAMRYYANDYWPTALRSLFYLEENWHCLAARAALKSHRHEGYERFCLDYVAFKSRLILEPSAGIDPEHVGGYSLSNMLPPHSTATAGFGEALAAAIPVKIARGMDVGPDRTLLRHVLEFVLRQQWTEDVCFACAPGLAAVGGFSETSASPPIRIDYVQHAMAALGHGRAALESESAPEALRTNQSESPQGAR
jgi:hypothetical protein